MITIPYVTTSRYKRDECEILLAEGKLPTGEVVGNHFKFELHDFKVREHLEPSLEDLVVAEAKNAYAHLRRPCIVEHAGLIFDEYVHSGYPGALTKPMWNVLDGDFVEKSGYAGGQVVARAVVGYCDGMNVKVFSGDTLGSLAPQPRGGNEFYWDTIFIPDASEGGVDGLTYAEICDRPDLGLRYKVLKVSQSTKALVEFLDYRRVNQPQLWA